MATQGSIVALPSESGIVDVAPSREGQQALGIRRPPGECAHPRSVHRERGIVHELVLAEPRQPLLQGLHAAVVVDGQGECVDQTRDGSRLTRGVAVCDRLLRQLVCDAPVHCTAIESGNHIRLAPLELVPQKLAEQMVIAIPLTVPVEGHDEAVLPRELLEHFRRIRRLEHRVTEAAAHAIQDRGAQQEPLLLGGQP